MTDQHARVHGCPAAAQIVYGTGELTGAGWIGIPRMVTIHGLANAIGFTLAGSLAHLQLWARAVERAP